MLGSIVKKLIANQMFEIFVVPVSKKDVPDYHKVISNPRCLSDIERMIKNDGFTTVETFYHEMSIIRNNCKQYNETRYPDVYALGERFWAEFLNLLQDSREELDNVAQQIDPVLRK